MRISQCRVRTFPFLHHPSRISVDAIGWLVFPLVLSLTQISRCCGPTQLGLPQGAEAWSSPNHSQVQLLWVLVSATALPNLVHHQLQLSGTLTDIAVQQGWVLKSPTESAPSPCCPDAGGCHSSDWLSSILSPSHSFHVCWQAMLLSPTQFPQVGGYFQTCPPGFPFLITPISSSSYTCRGSSLVCGCPRSDSTLVKHFFSSPYYVVQTLQ